MPEKIEGMRKIAVVGSTRFDNYLWVKAILDAYESEPFILVSGGAKGADTLGERYAKEKGYETMIFPALWARFGKAAGPIRNKSIVDASDKLYAFWDYRSKGTLNSVSLARKKGIPIYIVDIRKETPTVEKG